MGDTLLATPLIRDFKLQHPETSIEVIAENLPAQVLLGNPNISKVLISPSHGSWIGSYGGLYHKLWKSKYKLSIDLISTPGSALLSYIANAKIRIGYKLRGRSWAYNAPVQRRSIIQYSAISKYDLVERLDMTCSSPLPEIFPKTKYRDWAVGRITELKIDLSKPMIGICPWSKREWRRWEIDNWIRLLEKLLKYDEFQIIVFASNTERPHLSQLESFSNTSILWAGASHIHEVAALMNHCKAIITNDNGLKHVAVACAVPTLTFHVGSEPELWNPPDNPLHKTIDLREQSNAFDKVFTFAKEMIFKK